MLTTIPSVLYDNRPDNEYFINLLSLLPSNAMKFSLFYFHSDDMSEIKFLRKLSSRVWRHFDETFGTFFGRCVGACVEREGWGWWWCSRQEHENVIKLDVCTHPVAFERKIMLFVLIITTLCCFSRFVSACPDCATTAVEYKKRHLSPGRLMTHSFNGLVWWFHTHVVRWRNY